MRYTQTGHPEPAVEPSTGSVPILSREQVAAQRGCLGFRGLWAGPGRRYYLDDSMLHVTLKPTLIATATKLWPILADEVVGVGC
jgi:hypothetical protein